MPVPDHYATLGLHSGAEAVVITAAYRALAQRYHPDKWHGDSAEAHRRMSELNEAYRVLGSASLRAEYDAARGKGGDGDFSSTEREEYAQAFGAALDGLEGRWSVAVEIFPDLAGLREGLARTSTSLAFGFVTILLESKRYNERATLAAALERNFLERYFGKNATIIEYAKEIIADGHRDAARTLNHLVDVMGSEVDPSLLVHRIERQYGLRAARLRTTELKTLADTVLRFGSFHLSKLLAQQLGYSVEEHSSGFMGSKLAITVTHSSGAPRRFTSGNDFVSWVQQDLCA
jgi:curved DNA-binding protein CbpA